MLRAVTTWPIWGERRRVLAVLAVVEGLALAVPLVAWSPLSREDLDLSLALVSLSLIYSMFVYGWELARRHLRFERAPEVTPNVLGTWCFASGILLPPQAAAAVTAVAVIGAWPTYNPAGTKRLYRYVYSMTAAMLGATAASVVVRSDLPSAGRLPIAALTWLAIGAGATILALCASGNARAVPSMLHPRELRLEVITTLVAIGEYGLWAAEAPALMWLSLPAAVAIQRYFTRSELRNLDTVVRPMARDAWLHVARVIVQAAGTVSVIRIDTTDVQTPGLLQAASRVAVMQAGCDAIGLYDPDGLAILLPDVPPQNADALARRLRNALMNSKIDCGVAAAGKPRDGQVVEDLLTVCEAELVVSKEAARRSARST